MTISPRLRQRIEDALARDGACSYQDWLQAVVDGETVVFREGDTLLSVQHETYPLKTRCRVWLAAGDLDECHALLPRVEAWAREHGCTEIVVEGRPGWRRVGEAAGYEQASVVMRRRLV